MEIYIIDDEIKLDLGEKHSLQVRDFINAKFTLGNDYRSILSKINHPEMIIRV
jgi:hypothetical protein